MNLADLKPGVIVRGPMLPEPVEVLVVTLLGDAAHPTLPFLAQGAAMAVEDAGVIARALAARPDDIAHA